MNRKEFIIAGGALAVTATRMKLSAGESPTSEKNSQTRKLIISAPLLQNAAETSMGIGFAVSAMANGYVEYSTSPNLAQAKKVVCGGYRVTDMNDKVMLVRLTGLRPNTRYYYRIGADRISYKGGYDMHRLGTEIDPRIYSFTTLGPAEGGHFCVINDTHAHLQPFALAVDKIAQLKPNCVIWNGDACNTQETMESLVDIFYTPAIRRRDYAAETPYLFIPGNHDYRGLAARHLERVLMFRQPEERSSRDWDLGRNFAIRSGDVALIGLDTGEDKLDNRDEFAGLFNMEPYRVAQKAWLADALERPEIKSAPFAVAFCHIPLYDSDPRANPGDCDRDDNGRYTFDFAIWQRTCSQLWGPLLAQHGVQLVVTAHEHAYRCDQPNEEHAWMQLVGGGPHIDEPASTKKFPTVIEGRVRGGRLVISVHDVLRDHVIASFDFDPRKRV